MKRIDAVWLWDDLWERVVSCDTDGNYAIETLGLGFVTIIRGLSTRLGLGRAEDRRAVAAFLREWADAMTEEE